MAELTEKSTTAEFYAEAINVLLLRMGKSKDAEEIEELRKDASKLTCRMAEAEFSKVGERTKYLKALMTDLSRVTAAAGSGKKTAAWVDELNGYVMLAGKVVGAAKGTG